jgi:hypothetical protein
VCAQARSLSLGRASTGCSGALQPLAQTGGDSYTTRRPPGDPPGITRKGEFVLRRVRLGRTTLISGLVLAAAPSVALADGLPSFSIGPVAVNNGYTVTVFGSGCDTKYPGASVMFNKIRRGWSESHTYNPLKASCHLAKNLSSGSLSFTMPGEATVNVTFSKRGSKKRSSLPPGCKGQHPMVQDGVVKGTFKIKISQAIFGTVSRHRAKATAETSPNYTCNPTRAYKRTVFLNVSEGSEESNLSLNASQPPHGPVSVSIYKSEYSRATGSSSHGLTITGSRSLFTAVSSLASAQVNGSGKLHGHLKFKATQACQNDARMGTISGSISVHFDVIGTETIKATKPAPYAALSRGQGC